MRQTRKRAQINTHTQTYVRVRVSARFKALSFVFILRGSILVRCRENAIFEQIGPCLPEL